MINNSLLNTTDSTTLLHNITNRMQNLNITRTKSQLIVTIYKPRFITPINWSHIFQLTEELQTYPVFNDAFGQSRLIIGTKNDDSIGSIIINSTSNRLIDN